MFPAFSDVIAQSLLNTTEIGFASSKGAFTGSNGVVIEAAAFARMPAMLYYK